VNWRRAVQRVGRRTVNPVTVTLLRLGLPAPPYTPRSALVMETVGRRTGRRRTTPMGYTRESDDQLLVVAEHGRRADWVRNATAAGTVRIWLGRQERRGRITVLDDVAPEDVLRRIGPVHRAVVRSLAKEPRAVRIDLLPRPGSAAG
jgi:deazaflavin-dependent oxidoreductase (nitroreductase family)